jgi:UDP-glucose-4-epimerase GalE
MAVLVTGGAGYIGSVTVELLLEAGEDVVVLDDLRRGHRDAVDPSVPFHTGSIGDKPLVERIVQDHAVAECIHFAAFAYVGESVEHPARYFENNVSQGIAFLSALVEARVSRLVFSSTCATYGEPEQVPIPEDHRQMPSNPYGWTKLFVERILDSYDVAYGLRSVALRYFNAAGATAARGEDHEPETHLIPILLDVARGKRSHVSVFGNDYPTPDGTAIRDYIHVRDLATAHVQALRHLRRNGESERLNLGTGTGHSVLEVISTARRVTGEVIEVQMEGRRAGDPARLIAQPARAESLLGWKPELTGLETIIRSAWEWRQRHPDGYSS